MNKTSERKSVRAWKRKAANQPRSLLLGLLNANAPTLSRSDAPTLHAQDDEL